MNQRSISRALLAGFLLTALWCAPLTRAQQPQPSATASPQQPGATSSPALPRGIERVTSVEGITEYRLANGLKVLLFPDQTKQTITVNITYLVGSKHENYGETGMAHLLEHLVFKGTPRHPNIPQELTEHGARPNGTTWLDRTNYFETFAATDANLEWALDLEADRMVNSFIRRSDLDSEMTVVRNEFESGENNPTGVLFQRTLSTAYLWHNYGKSTIGSRADLENVSIDRLQAFYRNYYQPDNAVLLIAGKFDEARTLALVDRFFSPIPRPNRTLPRLYTQEPTQDGERTVTLRRVGDVQALNAVYHVPAGSHEDFAPLDLLGYVLGNTPSGRLHRELVQTGKASQVFNFNFQLRDPGVMIFGAEVRQGLSLDEARDILLRTIERVGSQPPTREEVDRARAALLRDIELALNSSDRVGLELSEWMAMGDWRLFFLHRDRLRRATPEDVARVAARYLRPSNRTLGVFIPTPRPERAEIPPTPDVAALLRDYRGDAAVATGEAFEPSPTNIESRTTRTNAPGGLEIALLPKETRGDSVVAAMTLRFGDERSLTNRATAAQMAGAMLMRGTTRRTRQQIQDELSRLRARVSVSGGATQATVFIETVRENLPAVMRLVAEVLREPAFPATEFEQLKQEQLSSLEQGKSEPNVVASTALSRHLSQHYPRGDVRYVPTIDESIADVRATTLEEARRFYTEFYGASNAQLSVVGDFDAAEIGRLANELFGNWRSPRSFARVPSVYARVSAVNQSFETPDKANAFFVAGLNLNVRDNNPDYPALLLGNFMLGGGFLNSRLATRIRQRDGLSYGVGSNFFASALDEYGSFTTFAIYAPQNAARLETAFREEIARVLRDGFTAEEVAAAKSGFLQGRQVTRAQDATLARQLANYLFLDRTLQWDAEIEGRIQALTPEQIVAAMRRHINPDNVTIIKAGDFAAGGAANRPPTQPPIQPQP